MNQRESRYKILFTEGASLSARQTLYALGGRHTIDILDPDPLCQCRFSQHVRRWYRSPQFARQPEDFLRFLADRLRRERYDVVLPTHEQVYLLSRFRDIVGQATGLALPDFAAMEKMQHKGHFTRTLAELNLPFPETVFVHQRQELNRDWRYPFYLKLAHSTAGAGVFEIRSTHDLRERADALAGEGYFNGQSEVLVQQPARGNQATIQAVFLNGRMIGSHTFDSRQLGVGGMSAARVSADHPIVREQVERLGAHLNWHGAMFIDYFYDYESGRPEYIECNPRIGETVNAWLSGTNLPEQLVRVSLGQVPEPLPLSRDGLRTQSFYMILLTLARDGASRWRLLREWRDLILRRGLYEGSTDELTRPRDDLPSVLPLVWISLQLLVWPAIAHRIVRKTVENYSLPESATERIKGILMEEFAGMFAPPAPDV
jgi:predicted ATP-grasp superfamily ATP-dependent carboligase